MTELSLRRKKLCQFVKNGAVLLLGNDEVGMNYHDNAYPQRQDSTFLYFIGIKDPGLVAIIHADTGTTTLYGNELSLDDIIWTGPLSSLKERAFENGIEEVRPLAKLKEDLAKLQIHTMPVYRAEHLIKFQDLLGQNPQPSEILCRGIFEQRAYKSTAEIAQMAQAVDISAAMHLKAIRSLESGKYEHEIVAELTHTMLQMGGQLAYPVIFSVNGQTLHNHSHHNQMQSGQLALGDFGAEIESGYCGDITRTAPVSGRFTSQQAEIYAIVLEMEETAISKIRAGVTYSSIHKDTAELMLQRLKELKIVQGDVPTLAAEGLAGLFMPHGLGHMIGLDVHDMENLGEDLVGYEATQTRSTQLGLKSLRLARTLEEGFALTVEPGMYFIPELIDKWKAEGHFKENVNWNKLESYRNFGGIRIEDNVVVRAKNAEVIGNPIPKGIYEIEDLIG